MATNAEILQDYYREREQGTNDNASSMSFEHQSAQATERLTQLQAEWDAAQSAAAAAKTHAVERAALDRAAAARAKGETMTPAAATARLEMLRNDEDFYKRYMSGEVTSRQEFDELTGLASRDDKFAALLDGSLEKNRPLNNFTVGGEQPLDVQIATVAAMREVGVSDGAIQEAFTGKPMESKAHYDACMNFFEDLLSNKAWVARLMAGDREANRQFIAGNIIKTNGYRA